MTRGRSRGLGCATLGLAALLATACDWSRFSDLSDDAPVVLLNESDSVRSGFGSSLSVIRLEDQSRLLCTGSPGSHGGAVYNLGTGDAPTLDAVDSGHCEAGDDPCFLGRQTAGLARATRRGSAEDMLLCFVAGVGRTEASGTGLLVRCDDDSEYTLEVPEGDVLDAIDWALDNDEPLAVVLSADRDEAPALVAGLAEEQAAWYYAPSSYRPQPLVPPVIPADDGFGASIAVLRNGDERLIAVGAPDAHRVWLFRSPPAEAPRPVGCLDGPEGFGRTMAGGRVDDDAIDDLVVADDASVTVLRGSRLAELNTASTGCSLASLPAETILASFGCGQTPDVDGCPGSRFGASLAVGDLDGDGDGEVVAGAPYLAVRGAERAGAVLVYDVEPDAPIRLAEVQFLSSAEDGDLLGTSVATPHIDGRDIIAAGAPGHAKAALFYCTSLLDPRVAGRRCQ